MTIQITAELVEIISTTAAEFLATKRGVSVETIQAAMLAGVPTVVADITALVEVAFAETKKLADAG